MVEALPEPGWYSDPTATVASPNVQLRYWDGSAWTDHIAHREAGAGAEAARRVLQVGLVVFTLTLVATFAFGFLALLTANACGPFADGCDDYGKTGAGFGVFASGALLSATVALIALLVVFVSPILRRRRR